MIRVGRVFVLLVGVSLGVSLAGVLLARGDTETGLACGFVALMLASVMSEQ